MTSKYRSFKTGQFNKLLEKLPQEIQKQASESFAKWKEDPNSVGFKPLGISNNEVWSAQVNTRYRALAKKQKDRKRKNILCLVLGWVLMKTIIMSLKN